MIGCDKREKGRTEEHGLEDISRSQNTYQQGKDDTEGEYCGW